MFRFVLAAAFVLIACDACLAQQARDGVLISTAELAARLKDPDLVILHVVEHAATPDQPHIPGARFVRYGDVAVDGPDALGAELPDVAALESVFEEAGVSDDSHVVLYGGPTVLVARVFFTLDVAGHRHVSVLDGGLAAWQAERRPVTSGPTATLPRGKFSPRINRDRIATADAIQTQKSGIALVDVRPDPEYTGSDGGMGGVHSPGHLEGARQLPWNTLMASDGRFLPADQLRERLKAAGATDAKPVVAYCMVGMRASVVYLAARHVGLDVRLYDGSIVDWTRRGLPTKTGR